MTTDKRIIQIGSSIGICIDKALAYASGFKLGDILEVECDRNKITFIKKRSK